MSAYFWWRHWRRKWSLSRVDHIPFTSGSRLCPCVLVILKLVSKWKNQGCGDLCIVIVEWWFSTVFCAGVWLQAAAQETMQEERAKVLKTDPVTPPKVLHAFSLGSRLDDRSSPQGCACVELSWGNNVGSRFGVGWGRVSCVYTLCSWRLSLSALMLAK